MSKVFGFSNRFKPVKEEESRFVISYGKEEVDGVNATWNEVYFNKKRTGIPTVADIRAAICDDIDARTRQRILTGFSWNGKPVWLSTEKQFDYKAAGDLAVQTDGANLPLKFKLGDDADGNPVYHTFTSVNALTDFCTKFITFIQQCLADGYSEKDGMDWSVYEIGTDGRE